MVKKTNYLIFKDANGVYGKVLKKGFGHIVLLTFDGYNWTLIEPTINQLEWSILSVDNNTNVIEKYFRDSNVVVMRDDINQKNKWICKPRILTCALFAKYYLGIDSYSFTPYQLYKHIIKYKLGEDYGFWAK
jgi:hypothetical protein